MANGELWTANGDGVEVVLPDGSSEYFVSELTAIDIKRLARESGVKSYHVIDVNNGTAVGISTFPHTSGKFKIEEHNEAKTL